MKKWRGVRSAYAGTATDQVATLGNPIRTYLASNKSIQSISETFEICLNILESVSDLAEECKGG